MASDVDLAFWTKGEIGQDSPAGTFESRGGLWWVPGRFQITRKPSSRLGPGGQGGRGMEMEMEMKMGPGMPMPMDF